MAFMKFILVALTFACFIVSCTCEYNCDYKKDGFYSDEDFCHIYWRCNYGVAEEYECPAGTAWNHIEGRCDWLDNVDCTRSEKPKGDDEDGEGGGSDDEESVEQTTRKSKKAKNKAAHETTTMSPIEEDMDVENADNKIVELLTSEKPSNSLNSQSASGPASLCQPFGSYFIPDNSNCAAYFMCNNGKESKMNCGEKQLFNADTSQCEEFQQVFCGSRPVNLADRNQCQGKRDGIYPDIERTCKVFYQCINQQKVREANCPSTFKFNSLSGRCDNPANIAPPCGTYGVSNAISLTSSLFIIIGLILLQKLTTFI